jgi:uncharacterized protein (DUF427 family)
MPEKQASPNQVTPAAEPECVWDYPRPPRIEACTRHLEIIHRGIVLADTQQSFRILETSHPPVYYIPQQSIAMQWLQRSPSRSSFCEFKGSATYWSLHLPEELGNTDVADVAWSYASPTGQYLALKDHLAFYASRVESCFVDSEQVKAQAGDFYGGWITSHVIGPFKGPPGTRGW